MANGAHALQLLGPEIPAAPASSTAIEIGDLVAQAVVLIILGTEKHARGQSTWSTTSLQTGELIAQLYVLQQSTPGFGAIAIHEGRRALRALLAQNAALCRRDDLDQTLDEILSWPLGVLARVTEAERAFAMGGCRNGHDRDD